LIARPDPRAHLYSIAVDPLERDIADVLRTIRPPPAVPRPALVVLGGLPGSGKSTVADALSRRTPLVVLRSDVIRKLLFPKPDYSSKESAWVFAVLHGATEHLLANGASVIVDATNLGESHRLPLKQIARRTGARLLIVWTEASDQEIRRRLTARRAGIRGAFDVSDAGIDVYEMMRKRVEPPRGPHIVIRTDRDYDTTIDRLTTIIGDAPAFRPRPHPSREQRQAGSGVRRPV
jgi:predicted kinase